jgi:hypothetical protein
MEMLELIESFRAEDAEFENLFGGEGRRLRSAERDQLSEAKHRQRLIETAKFIADISSGKQPFHRLREAMTRSDFPLLFADILDRQMLGSYKETEPTWQAYARRSVVPDLRKVKRFAMDGAEGRLKEVDELEEYKKRALQERKDEFSVRKFGGRLDLSWEAMINDDFNNFLDTPSRLARAARRTESHFATSLWVDEKGPDADLYKAGFNNIIKDKEGKQPVLSIESLQTAMTLLSKAVDFDGEPILIDVVTLVIPPALRVVAENILNATEIRTTVNGGVTGQELQVANWMKNGVNLQIEPWIPFIASKENGDSMWALFGAPTDGRPALEMGFLRGNEEPALFERLPTARRVGGGGGDALEDFTDDSRAWKTRHVLGGAQLTGTGGAKSTVASNGSGK